MDNGRRGKDLRIGDPERENAMRLLGEHFSAGRLDVTEYDERCRLVAAARFRSELTPLFDDLPEPRPSEPPRPVAPAIRAAAPPATGKIVLAVCAVVVVVFLLVVARQLALVLLLPLIAVLWFSWRR
ncbi:DUF1707 domain-containing protein [Saccharopolyspora shandongensis]|uniref:DUF1707 domain-containing protein n=1 Tax=Saccharopolyspora shandongensis TaxID=418495 RepID=A0A1H3F5P0_9PSEU|nr:DUF1707 domain-containing protein [Saccharopolyspora shandongensis]SDX86225.1 protein of unknown function [Saccharopolyspora shandongensis]